MTKLYLFLYIIFLLGLVILAYKFVPRPNYPFVLQDANLLIIITIVSGWFISAYIFFLIPESINLKTQGGDSNYVRLSQVISGILGFLLIFRTFILILAIASIFCILGFVTLVIIMAIRFITGNQDFGSRGW